jgi:uncharacterized membrane protein (Fun14 family)
VTDLTGEPDVAGGDPRRFELPRWKKLLLATAALFVLVGFALRAAADEAPGSGTSVARDDAATTAPGTRTSLVPGGTPGTFPETSPGAPPEDPTREPGSDPDASAATDRPSDWSPFFIKGGFSFFVGFCIGYALRAFFKISAVALGLVFLVLFALQYFELIQVDWAAADTLFDAAVDKVAGELGSVKGFVTGSLPSAALAAGGLYAGFKRTR